MAGADDQGPDHDFVVGTGQIQSGPIDVFVHVNAKSGPSGEDPQGHLVLRASPPAVPFAIDLEADITCLTVVGNHATVGLRVTKSKVPPLAPGNGGYFSFIDNGEPGSTDQFEGFPLPTPPTFCPLLPATRTVTNGNFVVNDALP